MVHPTPRPNVTTCPGRARQVPEGWVTRAFFALADNHGVLLRGLERDDEGLEELFHRVLADKS